MSNNEWKKVCAACAEGTPPARCAYYGDPNGCNALTLGMHPEGDLAERLQEALEKAERRIAELERAPGNAAAMREALEECRDYLYDVLRDAFHDAQVAEQRGNPSMAGYEREQKLHKVVDAALAVPLRNCDVGSDWLDDFYCNFHPPKGMREMPPEWVDAVTAFCKWLVAPAEGDAE